jgi:putative ATPase
VTGTDIIPAFTGAARIGPDGRCTGWRGCSRGGEDPLFIARRLVILASEDAGLADPLALQVAAAAQQAVHFIDAGRVLPAGVLTLYPATAPKSNW